VAGIGVKRLILVSMADSVAACRYRKAVSSGPHGAAPPGDGLAAGRQAQHTRAGMRVSLVPHRAKPAPGITCGVGGVRRDSGTARKREAEANRDHAWMSAHGIIVLLFPPNRIRSDPAGVVAELKAALSAGRARPLAVRVLPT
jgi:hypothetical protein